MKFSLDQDNVSVILTGYVRNPLNGKCECPPNEVQQSMFCTSCNVIWYGSNSVCPSNQLKCTCRPPNVFDPISKVCCPPNKFSRSLVAAFVNLLFKETLEQKHVDVFLTKYEVMENVFANLH